MLIKSPSGVCYANQEANFAMGVPAAPAGEVEKAVNAPCLGAQEKY